MWCGVFGFTFWPKFRPAVSSGMTYARACVRACDACGRRDRRVSWGMEVDGVGFEMHIQQIIDNARWYMYIWVGRAGQIRGSVGVGRTYMHA